MSEFLPWLLVAGLLAAAGFFFAAEAALFSLGSGRLAQMEETGVRAAATIRKLLEVPRRLIVTLILGAETANFLAAILIAWLFSREWPGSPAEAWVSARLGPEFAGPFWPSLIAAFLLILFAAQVLPRTLGSIYSGSLFRAVAFPLWTFMQAVTPLRRLIRMAAEFLLKLFGALLETPPGQGLAEEDIQELVEAGSREGVLDRTERELLVNLLQSGDITAGEIMIPRHEISAVPVTAKEEEARNLMEERGYSRLPVHEGGLSRVIGVVTAKGLLRLRLLEHEGKPASLREVMRPPLFVPESRKLRDLLLDFKRERIHMALVADEFGSISGLVTMEDVLAEIFGEVHEEGEELVKVGEGRWEAPGRLELAEFNERAGAAIQAPGARTLSGLILAQLGRRPRPGDEVKHGGFTFRVLEAQGIIILKVEAAREAPK